MNYKIETKYGKKLVVFNCSDGFDNWSQRRSEYVYNEGNAYADYSWLCNVHAYTDALAIAGYSLYSDKYPELSRYPDKLAKFCCEDKDVDNFYKSRAYSAWKYLDDARKGIVSKEDFHKNGLCSLNVHNVLCYAVNKFVGGPDSSYGDICTFSTNVSVKDILKEILVNGRPIVTSGTYGNLAGHIVCLVGFAFDYNKVKCSLKSTETLLRKISTDKVKPSYAIIDDPWGDMNDSSYSGIGNDVFVDFSKFISMTKDTNNDSFKYAHLFKGAIAQA